MSNEKHETVAGNVSAKHQFREVTKLIPHEEVSVAEMQQPLQPVTDCHGLNAAATRNALESVRNWCLNRLVNSSHQVTVEGLLSVVNEALSAPPRNCDVGTEEEQFERFDRWCNSKSIKDCWGLGCRKCLVAWSQMQYEEEKK